MTDLWYKSNLWRQLLWSAWKATWQLCVKWEIIGIKMSFDDKFQFERRLLCEMCNNWETMWSLKWIELPILVLLFLGPITYLDKYTYWTLDDSVFRRFWCVRNFIRANTLEEDCWSKSKWIAREEPWNMERVQNSVVIIRWHGFGFLEKSVRFLPDCCFQLLYYWLLLLDCCSAAALMWTG